MEHIDGNQLKEALRKIRELIAKQLPPPLNSICDEKLKELEDRLSELRAPKIAFAGRRGAGKSSLINAIFGQEKQSIGAVTRGTHTSTWVTYRGTTEINILDCRGFGENKQQGNGEAGSDAFADVKTAVRAECPDAFLFIVKASEVGAHLDDDLSQLRELIDVCVATHSFEPPVIGVVNQVDELSPKRINIPPFDHPDKQANIALAARVLCDATKAILQRDVAVLPVCSLIEFEGETLVYDRRWQIDTLVEFLFDKLPKGAQFMMARAARVKSVQRKAARIIINACAASAAAAALVPLPIADLPVLIGIQSAMISSIAFIGGREMNLDTAKELFSSLGINVAAGFVLRGIADAVCKTLLPVIGSGIAAGIAASATYGLGEAAIAYFIDGGNSEAAKASYKKGYTEEKSRREAARIENQSVDQK